MSITKSLLPNNHKLLIYTDGGARGNPGPAAIGAVVGEKKYSAYIGETTNNIAEYKAVILGLKKALKLLGKDKSKKTSLEIRLDSELVKKQLSGEYRIKDENMQTLFIEAHNLRFDFGEVKYIHIPREQNKEADRLVNMELDKL